MKLKPMPDFENMSNDELCLKIAEIENIETIKVDDSFYIRHWKEIDSLVPIYSFMDSDSILGYMSKSKLTVICGDTTIVEFQTKYGANHMVHADNLNRAVLLAHLLKDELEFRIDVVNGEYD